jgi:pre-mRNA-splicing factor SYF1
VYIQRVSELHGIIATRDIYERAIEALSDMQAKDICIRYAELERKLGEIDRARAIFGHASQFCDPRIIPSFWKTWQEFEIKHGNEDTFREMLRIKRSVQTKYNTQVNFLSAQLMASESGDNTSSSVAAMTQAPTTAAAPIVLLNDMQALESQILAQEATRSAPPGGIRFVSSSSNALNVPPQSEMLSSKANPDEILLESEEEEVEYYEDELIAKKDMDVEEQQIPVTVFGSMMTTTTTTIEK